MYSTIRLLVVSTILVWSQVVLADSDLVGDTGDSDRIRFVGNRTFDAKLLHSALRYDPDILIASHPKSSRRELLQLLEQRISDGYRHSGFPDTQVVVQFDDARSIVLAAISEGQRFTVGKVEVTGATTLPVDRFVERLINPPFDPTPNQQAAMPVWKVGKPASFSVGHWESKRDTIRKVFQNLGYHDVIFSTSVRAESDQTATLVIAIRDEGPRATLGEIEVNGCKKNTADDVIQYLNLKPGMVLDADAKLQIEKKLADAARFLKHDVEIITPPFGDAASQLRITLVEYDEAPPLTEPLSTEGRTLVKLANWLNQFGGTDDDFELVAERGDPTKPDPSGSKLRRGAARLVMSPQEKACLLHVQLLDEDGRAVVDAWIHLTPQTIALDAPNQSLRFEAKGMSQCVVGKLSCTATPPDEEGRISRFNFGFGLKGDSHVPLPPCILQTQIDPVTALRQAYTLKDSLKFRGDILTSDSADYQLAINSKSGRLLNWELKDSENGGFTRAIFEPGRYQKLLAEYRSATASSRVITAGDYPISNLMTFLANCAPDLKSDTASQAQTRIALAQSLLKRGAFHAFDSLLIDFFHHPEDDFLLPPLAVPSKNAAKVGWTEMLLPAARLIVPNRSWPVTISREYVFARTQQSPVAGQAIHAILTDQRTGPVENLTAAYVFGLIHPQLKVAFAQVGLTRLQRERFQTDCEPLLDPKAPVGKLLAAIGQTLQEVDVEEIESLVEQLPLTEGDQQALSHALRLIPAHKDDSPIEAIRVALDDAWEPFIEPQLRAVLNRLAH